MVTVPVVLATVTVTVALLPIHTPPVSTTTGATGVLFSTTLFAFVYLTATSPLYKVATK